MITPCPAGKPGRKEETMKKRYGITFEYGKSRQMLAVVTGEMSDGTKVWTECGENKELIDIDKQYTLQTRGGWSEFVRL